MTDGWFGWAGPDRWGSLSSDDFNFFDAKLSPSLIGETRFDETNLAIRVYYRNDVFYQLWFGGADHGAGGTREGNDDFFVQWSIETQTPPDTGFFSSVGATSNVTITGGNLDIFVQEPAGWTSGLVACAADPSYTTTDSTDSTLSSDLTGNGFVDFEDLTILLANWNQQVTQGNLVDVEGTPVNFEDLTVLLADWTGPAPAASPEAALGTEAVPEPSTFVLAALAIIGFGCCRDRSRRWERNR
ncbi:MAG: PEP-CTERM sorting domain-containing protein [Planctomycetes bacterium]|nr:PEP-CTERM sorting domain-containing protein [Planctomycetota bacterium]